ncbi:PPC domain-containing protein [Enterovibrio coralii]|uniref:PPC domain-containing protein n=1 Tax=Enterovibrio coralii TaxID=294935 RepID=UPI0018DBC00D|nr:PPC domain-containing protein [Enterovibrio coralii]
MSSRNASALSASTLNGDTVTISLSGGQGDADLYVRAGSAPTTTVYDCRSISSSNQEACTFANLSAGVYYVMVYGSTAFEGATLSMNSSSNTSSVSGGGGGGGSMGYLIFFMLPIVIRKALTMRR